MKKTSLFALLTAGTIMLTAGCGAGGSVSKDTAVKVGSMTATIADLDLVTNAYMSSGADFEAAKKNAVDEIARVFKYAEAAKAEGIELTEEDQESIIHYKASMRSTAGGTTEDYKKFAAQIGVSKDFLDQYAEATVYNTKLSEKLSEEIGDAQASDEEVSSYLKENYWRAKHILVAAPSEDGAAAAEDSEVVTEEDGKTGEELANLILEKAKNGENFDEMIKKYNTDPGMESNPDGYIFTEGRMVPEFEECVKNLKVGEFGIAKTSYGFHIIQKLSLDGSEEKFSEWVEQNKADAQSAISADKLEKKVDEICEKNNIKSEKNDDAINAFTEDKLVKPSKDEEAAA